MGLYPSVAHSPVHVTIPKDKTNFVRLVEKPPTTKCLVCGQQSYGQGHYCSAQCRVKSLNKMLSASYNYSLANMGECPGSFKPDTECTTERIALTGKEFPTTDPLGNAIVNAVGSKMAADAITASRILGGTFGLGLKNKPNPYAHQDCDAKLLWGELGWLLCNIAAYDDKFLAIADKVLEDEYDRSAIISLLEEIEHDGYQVNWEACIEVQTEKQSLWIRVKFKVLKWISHLLGDKNEYI